MCGRIVQAVPGADQLLLQTASARWANVRAATSTTAPESAGYGYRPSYNAGPGRSCPVMVGTTPSGSDSGLPRELRLMRWGIAPGVPSSQIEYTSLLRSINARASFVVKQRKNTTCNHTADVRMIQSGQGIRGTGPESLVAALFLFKAFSSG
jgi:putative SOS response-associated peptidase YedK